MTQLPLFEVQRTGPRGFPMCKVCERHESIGPKSTLCYICWSPELDPEGQASWERICAEHGIAP